VLKQKAVPEVLLKVVAAKKLLERNASMTVQEVTEKVGLSRSSFYKYKDDIFPFTDNAKGKTVTFVLQMDDTTINQTIPINGVASLTISIEVMEKSGDISQMIEALEAKEGIHYLKILAGEK
jgi:chorismate mutase